MYMCSTVNLCHLNVLYVLKHKRLCFTKNCLSALPMFVFPPAYSLFLEKKFEKKYVSFFCEE